LQSAPPAHAYLPQEEENNRLYRRILIATDGSPRSRRAIARGVALATSLRAAVVGFHARLPDPVLYYGEPVALPAEAWERLEKVSIASAKKHLAAIQAAANKASVRYKGIHLSGTSPSELIIKAAKKEKCDLIVMASHGRAGVSELLLGSETLKVLAHSHIPVLVTR
jgi:nucleotide-binding universal stress UspA family protein